MSSPLLFSPADVVKRAVECSDALSDARCPIKWTTPDEVQRWIIPAEDLFAPGTILVHGNSVHEELLVFAAVHDDNAYGKQLVDTLTSYLVTPAMSLLFPEDKRRGFVDRVKHIGAMLVPRGCHPTLTTHPMFEAMAKEVRDVQNARKKGISDEELVLEVVPMIAQATTDILLDRLETVRNLATNNVWHSIASEVSDILERLGVRLEEVDSLVATSSTWDRLLCYPVKESVVAVTCPVLLPRDIVDTMLSSRQGSPATSRLASRLASRSASRSASCSTSRSASRSASCSHIRSPSPTVDRPASPAPASPVVASANSLIDLSCATYDLASPSAQPCVRLHPSPVLQIEVQAISPLPCEHADAGPFDDLSADQLSELEKFVGALDHDDMRLVEDPENSSRALLDEPMSVDLQPLRAASVAMATEDLKIIMEQLLRTDPAIQSTLQALVTPSGPSIETELELLVEASAQDLDEVRLLTDAAQRQLEKLSALQIHLTTRSQQVQSILKRCRHEARVRAPKRPRVAETLSPNSPLPNRDEGARFPSQHLLSPSCRWEMQPTILKK